MRRRVVTRWLPIMIFVSFLMVAYSHLMEKFHKLMVLYLVTGLIIFTHLYYQNCKESRKFLLVMSIEDEASI